MNNYLFKMAAGLALAAFVAGCQTPIKGDASLFQGDKSRTLEARVKVGNDGPGLFIRERLTQNDYKNQSELNNFALTDALYSVPLAGGSFAPLVGSRSTAKLDTDNTKNNPKNTGHIDPRTGVQYGTKIDNLRLFVNVAPFWNVLPGEDHTTQTEVLGLAGYTHELSDGIALDLEAEGVLLMDGDKFKQGIQRLRGGFVYKGIRAGIGVDMLETAKERDPILNTGLYVGVRF